MKIYLKSGQTIEMNMLTDVECIGKCYGVGNYYKSDEDDEHIYKQEIYYLCSRHKDEEIEFYYGDCEIFVTNTSEIVGVEV